MSFAIRVDNLGKRYQLGATHAGSVRELVNRGWNRILGRPDAVAQPLTVDPEAADRLEGKSFWALRDVSFEVKPGEVVGIIGRNGSGKSTLLKILSQITAPTTGRVELHGRVASLLEVGTGFHPELSGRENVFLNGAILGMTKPEIRRKFDEIVAFAEIEKFIDTPVKRYSSGMYVRLAFAVAAHLEPEILIVDEVLAVGDIDFQKKCLGKMGEVASRGRTVMFVSHNMLAVQKLCYRCIFLGAGLLRSSGSVSDVVDDYLRTNTLDVYLKSHDGSSPKIVSARILTSAPRTNGPVEILIEWYLPETVHGIKTGVALNMRDQQRIFNSSPEDFGLKTPYESGYHKAIVRVPPNTLMAHHYMVSIGLWKGAHVYDHVIPALSLGVEPAPDGPYSHESAHTAIVQIACQWIQVQ